jgi:hypothetical protein
MITRINESVTDGGSSFDSSGGRLYFKSNSAGYKV